VLTDPFDSLQVSWVHKDVTKITTAIRFRFSAAQMSVIWPGLDLLFKSYAARQHKGGIRYEYPFWIDPPPRGFDCGTFDQEMMDEIIGLWKRLRPRAKAGGRVQMDTIESRATIFAIRANIDFVRKNRHDHRHLEPGTKARFRIDDESFDQLKIRSQRVICSLERHMKQANRVLLKLVTREQYNALVNAWKAHLRWMRLHIAHFKPRPPIIRGRKIRHQAILDELMRMADHRIRILGYQPPEPEELRRIMRLYASSARRWREGPYTVQYMMENKTYYQATCYLSTFVMHRLDLEKLSKS
jgi:hypothetical protein